MTEAEVRAIVRDEIEVAAFKKGGIWDQCRSAACEMTKTVLRTVAKHASESCAPAPARDDAEPTGDEKLH